MKITPSGAAAGKIGVLIEDHFDPTEFRLFNEYFPQRGYEVEYISYLWGNSELKFGSNPDNGTVEEHVTVTKDFKDVELTEYQGFICIGAYASDRLRYQPKPQPGQPNQAPAVEFLRQVMKTPGIKVGTICHSLWLLCADQKLLQGRKVTCAHNIICDVANAGAEIIFGDEGTVDIYVDGDLISGKHPAVTERFMEIFIKEIEHQ
ncbi:MAG: DJ-1/PfpI family protein [Cyanophyceae cyanobacterium]